MTAAAKTAFDRQQPATRSLWAAIGLLAFVVLLIAEPALANKFETIGGGLAGSSAGKRDWLTGFFAIAGGVSLLFGILAVAPAQRNAAFLNYATWKQSAIVLFSLAGAFLVLAVMI